MNWEKTNKLYQNNSHIIATPTRNLQVSRNETFDIIKGIAIILVVIGHSGCPTYLRDFIYLFHMPIFYFISGYFFLKKEINIKQYILRKIKSLYKPFVLYELIFLCLWGVFFNLHIINGNITSTVFFTKFINIFLFKTSVPLLPFWFLRSLFIINIIFLFQYIIIQKIKSNKFTLLVISFILFFIGSYFCINNIHFPLEIQRECILLLFFTLGFYYKINPISIPPKYILASLSILIICAFFTKIDLAYSLIYNPIILLVCSISGIIFLIYCSKTIVHFNNNLAIVIKQILCTCGKNSMIIFALHFLSFKTVSLIIIAIYNLNINSLSDFPTIKAPISSLWWIIYSIAGVSLPILLKLTINKINRLYIFKNE